MKRDLYAEVSTRIVVELERGAAPWVKPWSRQAGVDPWPSDPAAVPRPVVCVMTPRQRETFRRSRLVISVGTGFAPRDFV